MTKKNPSPASEASYIYILSLLATFRNRVNVENAPLCEPVEIQFILNTHLSHCTELVQRNVFPVTVQFTFNILHSCVFTHVFVGLLITTEDSVISWRPKEKKTKYPIELSKMYSGKKMK